MPSERSLRACHLLPWLTEAGGGVYEFARGLACSLHNTGVAVSILGPGFVDDQVRSHWLPSTVDRLSATGPSFLRVPLGLSAAISGCSPHIIHGHGLWSGFSLVVPRAACRFGVPYVLSPHGMLEPWAWAHHAWKKRPVWWLWERRFVHQAAVLHATAESEAHALRALGLRNPIAIIPPGVELPPGRPSDAPRKNGDDRNRTILFLSRIHPKKGLLNLVDAWCRVRQQGWRVIVAGPDECGHLREVQNAVKKAGVEETFEFHAPVWGDNKWKLLTEADLFVLPTLSENFGIVVVEALAAGVPVITTKGTPWEELHAWRCGWWIDIGVEPLTAALREAMALSDEQRKTMGQRGRRLVEENYSWPKIGADMKAVYDWVLGQGSKPKCVV